MKSITRTALLLTALFAPALAFAATDATSIAIKLINLINTVLVPLLFAIAFIIFIYGVAKAYIFSNGEPEKVSEGHKLILWGLIAFVVMISVWGLVNVVSNTFNLSGIGAPPFPQTPLTP